LAIAAALAADDLIVKYVQSRLLRLPHPASEIIIGNPAIVDIAIQSGNLLVVSGKSFGITNIIALDAERNGSRTSACSYGATMPRSSTCSAAPSGRPSIAPPNAIP